MKQFYDDNVLEIDDELADEILERGCVVVNDITFLPVLGAVQILEDPTLVDSLRPVHLAGETYESPI